MAKIDNLKKPLTRLASQTFDILLFLAFHLDSFGSESRVELWNSFQWGVHEELLFIGLHNRHIQGLFDVFLNSIVIFNSLFMKILDIYVWGAF